MSKEDIKNKTPEKEEPKKKTYSKKKKVKNWSDHF